MTDPSPGERTVLLDHVVVRDSCGQRVAEWYLTPDEPLGEPPPFVRRGVEAREYVVHRDVRVTGSVALPDPPALPPAPEVPAKDRRG